MNSTTRPNDVIVIGAGPAGVTAALRAAELGARTALVTRDEFGGMAANDGPVPVRTLAQAARLIRAVHRLDRFGITCSAPLLDYSRLLERVQEVVATVRSNSALRQRATDLGIALHERAGTVHLCDAHTIAAENGLVMRADRIILCSGGTSRRLPVPGAALTATHSDAWGLTRVPRSMLVIGGGMTGVQVASIFQAFGSRVALFQAAARILPNEDEDVSAAVAAAFRESGMVVRERFGAIDFFERTDDGIRMHFSREGECESVDAELAVVAVGWAADTKGLDLRAAGVTTDARGYVAVDSQLRTSAQSIYAAGDITGRWMLVPQAVQDGWIAATNAVRGPFSIRANSVCPTGGYTEPEYASVGLTEAQARAQEDIVVARVRFDETTRTIIDDRTSGFCKLLVARRTGSILGCQVVGERAVEIVQIVAIAMAGELHVDALVRVPLSFPTYTGILMRAAYRALEALGIERGAIAT
ncbi:MAG TPA: NAD(P)/FAD-dependent oxidoreductase [Steroidobacteraceae bacterium]|nr:NAD(P)/FAD-dependent oxidoreductase [Steroidobacteraceae bacterium]